MAKSLDKIAQIAKMTEMDSTASTDPILSELRAVDASMVKNKFGEVAKAALQGAIAISRYSRPELVLLSVEEYLRLEKARRAPLDQLTDQFDELVAKMQGARARKATASLFGASPRTLGQAAVKAVKAHG